MKKLFILFFATLALVCCENDAKDMKAKYETFTKKSDSILEVNSSFESIHNNMKLKYQKISDVIAQTEITDSTMLEDLRELGMIIEEHDAIMSSHMEIIEAHNTETPDFDNLDAIAFNEKIENMKQWHQRIENDHDMMKKAHSRMQKSFDAIEQKARSSSDK